MRVQPPRSIRSRSSTSPWTCGVWRMMSDGGIGCGTTEPTAVAATREH